MLCKCINAVASGQSGINSQQMHYVLEALSGVDTLRVVNSSGKSLLTPREDRWSPSCRGLTIAKPPQLGISEAPVKKKYLLRIFDKLEISTRVELVLYAVSMARSARRNGCPAAPEGQNKHFPDTIGAAPVGRGELIDPFGTVARDGL